MENDLKTLLASYKIYLLPVVTILLMLIIFAEIDMPKIDEIKKLHQELIGIEERLAKITTKSNFLANLDEVKLKDELEKVKLVLPDDKDPPSILRNLEKASALSTITIEDLGLIPGKIATIAATTGNNTTEIPVKLNVNGTISQMGDYFDKTINLGRAIGLKTIDGNLTDKDDTIHVQLELIAYFFLPTDADAKIKQIEQPIATWGSKENNVLTQILQRDLLPPSVQAPTEGKTDIFK